MAYEHQAHHVTLEQLLAQIPGVHGVRINRAADGAIYDLCVEIAPHSEVQHIVRRIRSVLSAHEQPGATAPAIFLMPAALPPAASELRVQLREIIHSRGQPIVTVTLALQGRRIVGIGRSRADTTASLEQLAGDATVQAMNRLINPGTQLCLEHVHRTQIGQLALCLVQLTVLAGGDQQTAIGVSIIRRDIAEAAARAVLDATNRYLPRLAPMQS
jgi:hypothetical protein